MDNLKPVILSLKSTVALLVLLIFELNVFAQQASNMILLKGKVFDKKHHTTIPGVTVKVGTQGISTDKNGNFTLFAPVTTLTGKGINFSCIGYLSAHLIYEPGHFYEVELVENDTQLKEVVIGAGDDIIKRAIKKIPENFPDKPFNIKGMLRTQHWRNQSQYFKSDAIIRAYIPSYGGSEKSTVAVLQNHIDSVYDKSLRYIRDVANYNIVDFDDIAHNRFILNKVLKRRKFDYWLIGKQVYNGHKVFVINTILKDTSKQYDKIDATFYIDTATYAFVATNIYVYNWVQFGFLKIKFLNFRVAYEQIGKKWYLSEIHDSFTSEYKKQFPTSTTDFIRTEIDSVNVQSIAYKDAVQLLDDVFLVDKHTPKEEWVRNDSLFAEAQNKGRLEMVSTTLLDSIKQNNVITNPPNKAVKGPFFNKVINYMVNGNIKFPVGITQLPITITGKFDVVSPSVNYGYGGGMDFRLYKTLYLNYEGYSNFWNNKHIDVFTRIVNLSNDFVFNRNFRSIVLAPYAGYEHINISYQKTEINYNSFDCGLRASYEVTHRKVLFLSGGYNSARGTSTLLNELTITPTHYEVALGFVFKL